MESEKRILTGREKDEAAIKLLEKLKEQLRSSDASNRRRAAFNLSWMQEDGLEILKDALTGSDHITTKNAAAYGLRKMHGKMKKLALEVLNQGLKHHDSSTRQISRSALQLLGQKFPGGSVPQIRAKKRSRIQERGQSRTTCAKLSIIFDSSAGVEQLAGFLGELAKLYYEFSDGDELVIKEGRMPSKKMPSIRKPLGSPVSV